MSLPAKVFQIFSSFGFATAVLSLLLLMTFLGTLEQLEYGLFESQRKYFESLFIYNIDIGCCLRAMHVPYTGRWVLPILLPGGGLLMLLAGLVSLWAKREGAVWVTENQTVGEFQSFHESVIQIEKLEPAPADGKRTSLLIPDSQFDDLAKGKARTFTNDKLPFDLMVKNYVEHCAVRAAKPADPPTMVVDGYILQELPKMDKEGKPVPHEQWVNGAYVTAIDKKTKAEQQGIIVRTERAPWTVKIGDEAYGIGISRRPYNLPFEVKLDKFVRETHPGTMQARKFSSHVTVIRDGKSEEKIINMNEPLRFGGFAFFQSSFDTEAAQQGGPQSSMFQVASNPSDHWPLISLLAAMAGLLMNLIWHLTRFLSQSRRKVEPVVPPAV